MAPSRYIEKVSLGNRRGSRRGHRAAPLLVHSHRDYHLVDVHARFMMSRVVKATGDEELARQKMKEMRELGHRTARVIAKMIGQQDPKKVARTLFGLKDREYYFRYKRHALSRDEIESRIAELQSDRARKARGTVPTTACGLRVLLTGGTGFVGKEILWQAAHDPDIAEVVVVIRPKEIRDRKTKEVIQTLSPAERGEALLEELWLARALRPSKFRFVAGDVEQPNLGISPEDMEHFAQRPSPTSSTAPPASPSTTRTRSPSAPTSPGRSTRSSFRTACSRLPEAPSSPTSGSRPPTSTAARPRSRPARTRSSSRATSTTTTTS